MKKKILKKKKKIQIKFVKGTLNILKESVKSCA